MSRASAEVSKPNSATIATAIRCSISVNWVNEIAVIASQNRRWSSTEAATLVTRSPAVVAHQSAKASFDLLTELRPEGVQLRGRIAGCAPRFLARDRIER